MSLFGKSNEQDMSDYIFNRIIKGTFGRCEVKPKDSDPDSEWYLARGLFDREDYYAQLRKVQRAISKEVNEGKLIELARDVYTSSPIVTLQYRNYVLAPGITKAMLNMEKYFDPERDKIVSELVCPSIMRKKYREKYSKPKKELIRFAELTIGDPCGEIILGYEEGGAYYADNIPLYLIKDFSIIIIDDRNRVTRPTGR